MTRKKVNHFDLCYTPEGTFAYNLQRVADGISVCVNWPHGGKPGSSGPRVCKSLPELFSLMRSSWSESVEEDRTSFDLGGFRGWEKIPVGTTILSWARREDGCIYALPPYERVRGDVNPREGFRLGTFPEFVAYVLKLIRNAKTS